MPWTWKLITTWGFTLRRGEQNQHRGIRMWRLGLRNHYIITIMSLRNQRDIIKLDHSSFQKWKPTTSISSKWTSPWTVSGSIKEKKMGAENGRDAEGFWEDSKGNSQWRKQQALPSAKTKKTVWGSLVLIMFCREVSWVYNVTSQNFSTELVNLQRYLAPYLPSHDLKPIYTQYIFLHKPPVTKLLTLVPELS